MNGYETVIGLEVHAQLATAEKLFCGCPNQYGGGPNEFTCPVCLGLPGALPVLNERAVELALTVGMAVHCTPRPVSVFARKHYFYPDLPKGFQITQFDRPILEHGRLEVVDAEGTARDIRIDRIHMEEDAGKSSHGAGGKTLVDLNRAGVPLVEIVSAPDLRSADEAVQYLKALHAIVRWIGACDGNLEEGSFRCDANVSVRPRGSDVLGTRTEIKNMNTFKGVHRAITYEAARQIDAIARGEAIVQETRLWDDDAGRTRTMRSKEDAHDYRYFPEPDLPALRLADAVIEHARAGLPELPAERRDRFIQAFELSEYDANVLVAERALADYFEAAVGAHPNAKGICNWITTELLSRVPAATLDAPPFEAAALGRLVALIDDETISGRIAKQVFEGMLAGAGDPDTIIEAQGLRQVSDTGAIDAAVAQVLTEFADQAAEFRGGKDKLRGFFVGQVMRRTQGKANPGLVNAALDRVLEQEP